MKVLDKRSRQANVSDEDFKKIQLKALSVCTDVNSIEFLGTFKRLYKQFINKNNL